MKKLPKLSLLLFLIGLLLTWSCKKDNQRKPDDPVKDIKKATNVFEVDKQTDQKLMELKDDEIVFNGNTAQLDSVKVGSIIISGTTENAPDGYLRKVTGIEKNGSEYVFATEEAALTEAFENLDIDYTYTFSDADSNKRTEAFEIKIPTPNVILYDADANHSTVYDQLKFNGNIVIKPSIDIKIRIRNFKLEYALVGGKMGYETDLSTNFGGNVASFTKSMKLYEQIMGAFTIPGTPIVVTPTISVNLGAKGNISAELSYLQSSTGNAGAYLQYINGAWSTGSVKEMETETSFSGFSGNASMETYLSPAINLKFYGSDWAKGSVFIKAYATIGAQAIPYKPCELKAGVSGGAEANLAFFGRQFASASYPDVFDFNKTLYTCSAIPPVNTNPYLNPSLTYGSVTDIEGNKYATIQIGYQIWMAENLRTTKYNDGTAIPNVTDNTAWKNLTTGAYTVYNFSPENEAIYGKLYNWYAVNTGKLCPQGWHIPTEAEWTQLNTYLGSNAGKKMKSTGYKIDSTGLWEYGGNYEGTNESGFTGLPGGYRSNSGSFYLNGSYGFFWSSTETGNKNNSKWLRLSSGQNSAPIGTADGWSNGGSSSYNQRDGYSCRCVKD
ncbi:MAG: fibrobacter succinogenes major paralogous domain-containing protein [Chitinophagales bacterium]|nr:fibrobacter succinogenes major paralogous domain-containing protein [Chitinophagales bacterium]